MRCGLAHFKLCAHFLQASSKRFNLPLLFRELGLKNLLLLRHRCFQLLHLPRLHTRFCIFPHNLASDFPQYMSGNQRGQNNENLIEKEFFKMKTFIVYDLDSKMPVAVGEQVSAETARYCASVLTGIFHENLLAEEIDLEEQITH